MAGMILLPTNMQGPIPCWQTYWATTIRSCIHLTHTDSVIVVHLSKLRDLYERNALTDDEFSKVKSKLTDILGYDKKEQRKYDVSSNSNIIYQLRRLNELAAEGRITSDEFTKGKANLIERFGE